MLPAIENIDTDFDAVEYLQILLISHATGGAADENHYLLLRSYFLDNPKYRELVPNWIKKNRNLDQFWQFIKVKFPTYAERRSFLNQELNPILDFIESKKSLPASKSIDEVLNKFTSDSVHHIWEKALERKSSDPEGAITLARTLLESTCKHILEDMGIEYDEKNIDLSELYKLTAKKLNLAPDQHTEIIFKQILGGCSGIVNGLGLLRNKHGDAHGGGLKKVKPKPRHAELAVNLAGTMALFLVSTYIENKP